MVEAGCNQSGVQMTIVSWQWPLVLGLLLIRLLAPGWYLILTLMTLGLPLLVACAPLLFAANLVAPEQYSYLQIADVLLVVAAFTLPDGGDNRGHRIPLLTLVKFDPEISERNPIGKALVAIGVCGVLGYVGVLLVMWAEIAKVRGWSSM